MSDTPRTDAAEGEAFVGRHGCFGSEDVIQCYNFARELERELAVESERIKELEEALQRLIDAPDNRSVDDFTCEELESWANAKAVLENKS